nr:hypothetical protein [Pandoravirus belohorizontensis]
MALHYSPSVDAIVIRLTPAEYVIDQTFGLEGPSTAFLDVDTAGKGVHIEFLDASDVFACHFYDHDGDVDGHGCVALAFIFLWRLALSLFIALARPTGPFFLFFFSLFASGGPLRAPCVAQ